jgi:type II secretory pathway pseudopilin PulG
MERQRVENGTGTRRGFSLLLVLVFVMIMAVIGALTLEFMGTGTLHTRQSFMDIRAKLMARAGAEFGLMAIEAHDFSTSCLKQVNMSDPAFDVNMTFHYFMTDCGACGPDFCTPISTSETNGSVLVYLQVVPKIPGLFRVRTFRLTLQNP